MAEPVSIRTVRADDLDWIVQRHAALYAAEAGFDESFGTLVRTILDAWWPAHHPVRERGFMAERGGVRLGTIFCVRVSDDLAKLRLFLLEPESRGEGLGRRMLAACLGFAHDAGYRRMTLGTHESHAAACALYRATGFTLVSSHPVRAYGQDLIEQHWEIAL
jgi:GNAT superfamily N-acetyltransferase